MYLFHQKGSEKGPPIINSNKMNEEIQSTYLGYNETDFRKLFLSRIPPKLDNIAVKVLLEQEFSVEIDDIHLVINKDNNKEVEDDKDNDNTTITTTSKDTHLGYGYVTFKTEEDRNLVLAKGERLGG